MKHKRAGSMDRPGTLKSIPGTISDLYTQPFDDDFSPFRRQRGDKRVTTLVKFEKKNVSSLFAADPEIVALPVMIFNENKDEFDHDNHHSKNLIGTNWKLISKDVLSPFGFKNVSVLRHHYYETGGRNTNDTKAQRKVHFDGIVEPQKKRDKLHSLQEKTLDKSEHSWTELLEETPKAKTIAHNPHRFLTAQVEKIGTGRKRHWSFEGKSKTIWDIIAEEEKKEQEHAQQLAMQQAKKAAHRDQGPPKHVDIVLALQRARKSFLNKDHFKIEDDEKLERRFARRRSCECSDCGGISKLESSTMNIAFEIKRPQQMQNQTPRIDSVTNRTPGATPLISRMGSMRIDQNTSNFGLSQEGGCLSRKESLHFIEANRLMERKPTLKDFKGLEGLFASKFRDSKEGKSSNERSYNLLKKERSSSMSSSVNMGLATGKKLLMAAKEEVKSKANNTLSEPPKEKSKQISLARSQTNTPKYQKPKKPIPLSHTLTTKTFRSMPVSPRISVDDEKQKLELQKGSQEPKPEISSIHDRNKIKELTVEVNNEPVGYFGPSLTARPNLAKLWVQPKNLSIRSSSTEDLKPFQLVFPPSSTKNTSNNFDFTKNSKNLVETSNRNDEVFDIYVEKPKALVKILRNDWRAANLSKSNSKRNSLNSTSINNLTGRKSGFLPALSETKLNHLVTPRAVQSIELKDTISRNTLNDVKMEGRRKLEMIRSADSIFDNSEKALKDIKKILQSDDNAKILQEFSHVQRSKHMSSLKNSMVFI